MQSQMASDPHESQREKAKLIEDGRAFFCSELVVKAYKCCGILQQTDEACSNFLPSDLTSIKDRLQLVDGASLGKELLIFTETMFQESQQKLAKVAAEKKKKK